MDRYWQQIAVPEIGSKGQHLLATAKVLLIGAGGLGTPAAIYLAAAGVGTIGLVDGDNVTVSNLSRQFLYHEHETGHPKVSVLANRLRQQNPVIVVREHMEMLNTSNAHDIISAFDIICDCTDNVDARILINQTCAMSHKPLVYAAVKDWEGYVTVLHHRKKIDLQNIFSIQSLLENSSLNCSVTGIVNTTCGIAGSIQATEVIKIIVGLPSELDGSILCFNTLNTVFRTFRLNA
ncbi:MAG: HesA/MoeB/ThiF family protein [Chitinophagaceae bacterium]